MGQTGKNFVPSSPRFTATVQEAHASFSTTQQLLSNSQAHLSWKTNLLDFENFLSWKEQLSCPKKTWRTHSKDPKQAGKIKKYWRSVEDQNHALPELAVLHATKVN